MKIISKIIISVAIPFLASSCATLTNVLSITGNVANDLGYEAVGSAAQAGASFSKAAESITPENEYYIGRAVAANILTNYTTYENKAAESYLNKICITITENSAQSELYNGYHIKMLNSDEKNAFSTSGGHIFITKGMLKCAKSEDSLAAVIAHEIAHIHLKHSLKAIKSSRYTAALKKTASSALTIMGAKELATTMDDMVGDVFTEMVKNGYSQEQEFDADALALKLMNDAGYDPRYMNEMLSEINTANTEKSSGIYKTHPNPEKRMKKVDSALKKITVTKTDVDSRTKRFEMINF